METRARMSRKGKTWLVIAALAVAAVAFWLLSGEESPKPRRGADTERSEATGDQDTDRPPSDGPTVEGQVLEGGSSRPVGGAEVFASCREFTAGPLQATTDEEGRFSFDWLPEGQCRISARREGFSAGGPSSGPANLTIRAGAEVYHVDLRLWRAASVSGVVLVGDRALAGATISVVYYEAPGETETFSLSPGVRSGDEGQFVLTDVLPGTVQVLAEHDDYVLGESDEITLKPGELRERVVIRMPATGEVLGRVVDSRGRGIASARLTLGGSPAGVLVVRSDRRGFFGFEGVRPGPFTLVATAPGYGEVRDTGIRVVGGDAVEVEVELREVDGFGGIVIDPEGRPVADAAVFVGGPRTPRGSFRRPDAHTDSDGRFWVPRLPRPEEVCYATHPHYAPSDDVPAPEPGDSVELRLGSGGKLVGHVVDGNGDPVTRYFVQLEGFRPAGGGGVGGPSRQRLEVEAEDGAFTFEGLAPGRYDLRVSATGYPMVISRGHNVMPSAETDTGAIRLFRGGSISGRVVDGETGEPIPQALVMVASRMDVTAIGGRQRMLTDAAGRFMLEGIPPQRLSLRVRHAGYTDQMVSAIELNDGETTDLGDIVLAPSESGATPRGRMRYSGIGTALAPKGGRVVVQNVFDGSPASGAGLTPGTEIVTVNGEDAAELGVSRTVELIRGETGTEVVLEVIRPGSDATEMVRMFRSNVEAPSARGMLR